MHSHTWFLNCWIFPMQDSWRELANVFANERVLFSLNAIHQVLNSDSISVRYMTPQESVGGRFNYSLPSTVNSPFF